MIISSIIIILILVDYSQALKLQCRLDNLDAQSILKPALVDSSQIPLDTSVTLDPPLKFEPNDIFEVRVDGLSEEQNFFMIQAQDQDGNTVGQFVAGENGARITDCQGTSKF